MTPWTNWNQAQMFVLAVLVAMGFGVSVAQATPDKVVGATLVVRVP